MPDYDLGTAEGRITIRQDVDRAVSRAEKSVKGFGQKLKGISPLALAAGAAIAISFGKKALDAFAESAKVGAQTAAVIKSTGGVANVSAGQVDGLAQRIKAYSGISDEAIASGENMLLTFTNIQNRAGKNNDIFNQSTKVLADMSVALGTDMAGQAIQLGKALNDPVKGVTALTRVGVTFTDQQRKQIKAMVKTGDTAGAQKLILGELNREFGGSARAAGKALGPQQKLAITMDDLAEKVGSVLVPALNFLLAHLRELGPVILGLVIVVKAAMLALTTEMEFNPIILAIAALVVAIALLITHFKQVKKVALAVWNAILSGIGTVLAALLTGFKLYIDFWLGWVKLFLHGAAAAFGWIPGIGGKLKKARDGFDKFVKNVNSSLDNQITKFKQWGQSTTSQLDKAREAGSKLERQMANIRPPTGTTVHFARGVRNWRGGMAVTGEHGRELAMWPRGTTIIPHGQTERILHALRGRVPHLAGGGGPSVQLVADGGGRAIEGKITITNWKTGEGFFRAVAIDEIVDDHAFRNRLGRM